MQIINVLTIGGSDPSGGAGIQADIKTCSALGAYATSVITLLTVQNTHGIFNVHIPPSHFIKSQINAIFADVRIDAVKIGVLVNAEIIALVADILRFWKPPYIILDTVTISKNGYILLDRNAYDNLCKLLFPLTTLITPNIPEIAQLLNVPPAVNEKEMILQGKKMCKKYDVHSVLVKGGHLNDRISSPDWLVSNYTETVFNSIRVNTSHNHGTGCTLSAAISALLPITKSLEKAIFQAKNYLTQTLIKSERLNVGTGIGPVHHFFSWW